jgi:hypothetical protein
MSKGLKILYIALTVVIFMVLGIWYLSTTKSVISVAPIASSTQNYQATVVAPVQPNGTTQSSDTSINSFVFAGLNPEVDGSVDNTGHLVNLIVPSGTDLSSLVPTIIVSDNATIYPNSGATQNFTNPVIYTVTAQDGSIQDYTMTVTEQNPANE